MKALSSTLSLRWKTLSLRWKILISVIFFINLLVLSVCLCFNEYRSLIWLFYYSALSNCPISWIVPLMPQEPMLLLYGTLYDPLLVALIAGIATFIIELLNYQMLVPVLNTKQLEPFKHKRSYKLLERYFNRSPFGIIAFVGFTPVPHLPFRILAVITHYPIVRYALASFVGRISFYYLVAKIGRVVGLPYWIYIIFLLIIVIFGLTTKIIYSYRND